MFLDEALQEPIVEANAGYYEPEDCCRFGQGPVAEEIAETHSSNNGPLPGLQRLQEVSWDIPLESFSDPWLTCLMEITSCFFGVLA